MKILILKTSALGDLLQVFPVINYLKERFPEGILDWVVEEEGAALIQAHPAIRRVWKVSTRSWRRSLGKGATWQALRGLWRAARQEKYDCILDLQGNIKSGLLLSFFQATDKVGWGWKEVPEKPNILFTTRRYSPAFPGNMRAAYLSLVQAYFQDDTPYTPSSVCLRLSAEEEAQVAALPAGGVVLCPGAAWENKRLSRDQWQQLLSGLPRRPLLFAWGTQEEQDFARSLLNHYPAGRLLPRLSLPALQHVMARAYLVIAMDSLALHLCGTTETPSWSFFGPSQAAVYAPWGKQHQTLQGSCPYGVKFERRCPYLRTCSTGACIKNVPIPSRHISM